MGTHIKKINNTDIKLPEDMTVIVLNENDMIELFRKDTLRDLENLDKYKQDQTFRYNNLDILVIRIMIWIKP